MLFPEDKVECWSSEMELGWIKKAQPLSVVLPLVVRTDTAKEKSLYKTSQET